METSQKLKHIKKQVIVSLGPTLFNFAYSEFWKLKGSNIFVIATSDIDKIKDYLSTWDENEQDQQTIQQFWDTLETLTTKFDDVVKNEKVWLFKSLEDEFEDLYDEIRESKLYTEKCVDIVQEEERGGNKYISKIKHDQEIDEIKQEHQQTVEQIKKEAEDTKNELTEQLNDKTQKLERTESEFEEYKKTTEMETSNLKEEHANEITSKDDEIKKLKEALKKSQNEVKEKNNMLSFKDSKTREILNLINIHRGFSEGEKLVVNKGT